VKENPRADANIPHCSVFEENTVELISGFTNTDTGLAQSVVHLHQSLHRIEFNQFIHNEYVKSSL